MKNQVYAYDESLTHEALYKHQIGSQFDVVNRAITVATDKVKSGADIEIDSLAYDTIGQFTKDQ